MDETHHHLFETPIGVCGVAWNGRGLCAVQLPEKDPATTERRLSKKSGSSSVAVDLSGIDDVRRRIYEALRGIDFGRTTTYGELARAIGATDWEGARDVGVAMGRNPMPIVIPCHRVLAAGSKVGGFSAYGGAKTKEKLLALEGVSLDGGPPRLPGL
jgi:methylated-DNA-[protein]-cysteine S-methyltransferase